MAAPSIPSNKKKANLNSLKKRDNTPKTTRKNILCPVANEWPRASKTVEETILAKLTVKLTSVVNIFKPLKKSSTENKPEKIRIRSQLEIGTSCVFRALERGTLACVLISGQATPAISVDHIISVAQEQGCPLLCLDQLSPTVARATQSKCLPLAIGFKKMEDNSHSDFTEIISLVKENVTVQPSCRARLNVTSDVASRENVARTRTSKYKPIRIHADTAKEVLEDLKKIFAQALVVAADKNVNEKRKRKQKKKRNLKDVFVKTCHCQFDVGKRTVTGIVERGKFQVILITEQILPVLLSEPGSCSLLSVATRNKCPVIVLPGLMDVMKVLCGGMVSVLGLKKINSIEGGHPIFQAVIDKCMLALDKLNKKSLLQPVQTSVMEVMPARETRQSHDQGSEDNPMIDIDNNTVKLVENVKVKSTTVVSEDDKLKGATVVSEGDKLKGATIVSEDDKPKGATVVSEDDKLKGATVVSEDDKLKGATVVSEDDKLKGATVVFEGDKPKGATVVSEDGNVKSTTVVSEDVKVKSTTVVSEEDKPKGSIFMSEGDKLTGATVVSEGGKLTGATVVSEGDKLTGATVVSEGGKLTGATVVSEGGKLTGATVVSEGDKLTGATVVSEGDKLKGTTVVSEGDKLKGTTVVSEDEDNDYSYLYVLKKDSQELAEMKRELNTTVESTESIAFSGDFISLTASSGKLDLKTQKSSGKHKLKTSRPGGKAAKRKKLCESNSVEVKLSLEESPSPGIDNLNPGSKLATPGRSNSDPDTNPKIDSVDSRKLSNEMTTEVPLFSICRSGDNANTKSTLKKPHQAEELFSTSHRKNTPALGMEGLPQPDTSKVIDYLSFDVSSKSGHKAQKRKLQKSDTFISFAYTETNIQTMTSDPSKKKKKKKKKKT